MLLNSSHTPTNVHLSPGGVALYTYLFNMARLRCLCPMEVLMTTKIKWKRKKRICVFPLGEKKIGKTERLHKNVNLPESSNIQCCQTAALLHGNCSSCACAPIFLSKTALGVKPHLRTQRSLAISEKSMRTRELGEALRRHSKRTAKSVGYCFAYAL